MTPEYSLPVVRELQRIFRAQKLHRPRRVRKYEPADILDYDIRGVWPPLRARAKLRVERFVGGGFAGQVYKAVLIDLEAPEGSAAGLEKGRAYALKILVPPTGFGRAVRGLVFGIGFQAPFSLQSNPDAARAGALWQKFIRRGAGLRLGSERAVVDILATLVDPVIGSCGEISEWVEGRLWRYEVDDNLFARLDWKPGRPEDGLGSPEYRAKRTFMRDLVGLMHDMGAHELARQYEWWTLKSQPNALKRLESEADSRGGLVAVDFRPGMALLPVLPQCPADLRLIVRGAGRGSLVQFDRGDIAKLEGFAAANAARFGDMAGALDELKATEKRYRESLPDVSRNHVQLILKPRLWKSIAAARIRSWEIRNMTDKALAEKFKRNPPGYLLFLLLGLLPLLTPVLFLVNFPGNHPGLWLLWLTPLLGPFARRLWGKADFRKHWSRVVSSFGYARRAYRGRVAEKLIRWHRAGRAGEARALSISRRPWIHLFHLPLSVLPPGLHRFLTDGAYFRERLDYFFVRPVRLYFRPEVREKWLTDMIAEGGKNGMLTDEERGRILSQIKDPFIQKYLKSLAVHMATLFVSETVFLTIAAVYVLSHPELGWQQATVRAGLMLAAFNLLPVSPGSLVRGFYVLGLIARERNFKDYRLALSLSFFKMIGYLAFPLQMAYRYPELARFMAGHWATGAVRIVPVFGERGAWLEHAVFDLFYNYPLSLGKRIRARDRLNMARTPRPWAVPAAALLGAVLLGFMDWIYAGFTGRVPLLGDVWWIALCVPVLCGLAGSLWSRRPRMGKRLVAGVTAGGIAGLLYAAVNAFVSPALFASVQAAAAPAALGAFALDALWKVFVFTLLAIPGALAAETRPPAMGKQPTGS